MSQQQTNKPGQLSEDQAAANFVNDIGFTEKTLRAMLTIQEIGTACFTAGSQWRHKQQWPDDETLDAIIHELDNYARDQNPLDLGLPIYKIVQLRKIIRQCLGIKQKVQSSSVQEYNS